MPIGSGPRNAGRLEASGIILAGGASTRMGLQKLDLPWGAGTLLSHAVEVMLANLEEVLVVGSPGRLTHARLRHVDDASRIGPAGGLLAGLEAATYFRSVVVAADMPFIDGAAIRALWDLSEGASITVVRTTDGLHPLFGIYAKTCLPALSEALERGDRRMVGFWDGLPVRVVDVANDPWWNRILLNVNSMDDYHRAYALASRLASGHSEEDPPPSGPRIGGR